MTTPLKGRPVTVVYHIEDWAEWRKINPLQYRHNGLVAVEVAAMDACEGVRALETLMPFVLEDYFPYCATREFRTAVENAKRILNLT